MSALEIASKLLEAVRTSWQDAASMVIERERTLVKIWNGEAAVVQKWKTVDSYLRLGLDGRLVVLELSTSDPGKIADEAGSIWRIARRLEPSEIYSPLPQPTVQRMVGKAGDQGVKEFMEDPSPLVEEALDEVAREGGERASGTLSLELYRRGLATTAGFEGEEERTLLAFHLRAFAGEGSGHWSLGSTRLDRDGIREVGRRAGEIAIMSRKPADFSPGKFDVVLSPMVMGNLMNILALMSSALATMMGYSFLSKYKVGDAVGSQSFSLYDRPRDQELPGGALFDDEGVETVDKAIFEGGKLLTLLHNTATASRNGGKSTGNAGWVMPRAWNLDVLPGDVKEEEMAEILRNGIIIMNNWYTRLQNYVEGQFSTVSRDGALLVKDGEIVGNLGRVRLSTSLPRMLSSIEQLSRERSNILWWEVEIPTRSPFALIRGVNLTRPEV
ncbi:MAG: TldD/PmbA family protein [Fervidicoccaceae archaeon]